MSVTALPRVDWMFIHPVQILRADGEPVVDDEGRWQPTAGATVNVHGFVEISQRAEQEEGNAFGVRVDAVCALPRDTAVDETDRIRVALGDPWLDGTYRITAVRPTLVHVRALMQRDKGLDGSDPQEVPGGGG